MRAVTTHAEAVAPRAVREAAVVGAAERLAPRIRAAADAIEVDGRLPDDLADDMAAADLFQLFLPADAGGPEVSPLTALLVTEQLARADGSVGWCASVSSALSNYLGWLPADGLAEVAGSSTPRLRLSGSARPLGTAVPVEGGFIARGRWDFASNIAQSHWYAGTCVIDESRPTGAQPRARAMLFPVADGRIVPTWSVLGMRGTGSHDFAVEDVFVPARRVTSFRHALARTGRVFHPRLARVVIWAPTAGVALGIARGALDDFAALSRGASTSSPVPLCQRPDVQTAVGRAEAIVAAARAYCVDAIGAAWQAVGPDGPGDGAELDRAIAHARLSITHAMSEAVRVVDLLQRAAGTGGVYTVGRLERRFRDAHVAVQHAAGLDQHVEATGRVLLGLPSDPPFV
jgi:alkylation response protein AidB-like acyl-CoA dehydrogenase